MMRNQKFSVRLVVTLSLNLAAIYAGIWHFSDFSHRSPAKSSASFQEQPNFTPDSTHSSAAQNFPWLASLVQYQEFCPHPKFDSPLTPDQLFYQSINDQLTCPHSADDIQILEKPESGFLAKIELLLGQKLPPEILQRQDPYAPIDFSKAPHFRAIYLATLVYRADFYGTLLARLLKYHAQHGTLVQVFTTGYMLLEKDQKLLNSIASQTRNFKVQKFTYRRRRPWLDRAREFHPLEFIDAHYRNMHIKLMITLSDEDTKNNSIIFGGRNIHDGFLFKTQPNYEHFPDLVQYGKEDDFVHWSDLEIKITSQELATTIAAHLLKVIHRDDEATTLLPIYRKDETLKTVSKSGTEFRHFISIPYQDHHALEDLYTSLIDSASQTIEISSPYLRPTEKIINALQRATQRGVKITIQTRVELKGDTQAWLYEEVNKETINRLYQTMKIYEWKEASILHSKFMLIDDQITIIGSVNLSRRSFIQDIENVFLIKSSSFNQEMKKIFNSYLHHSILISAKEERKLFPSILIQILRNQF